MFHLIIWHILFPDLLQYLIPWARVGEATSTANDPKQSAELWNWLEDQVKDIWSNILFIFPFEDYISRIAIHANVKLFSVWAIVDLTYYCCRRVAARHKQLKTRSRLPTHSPNRNQTKRFPIGPIFLLILQLILEFSKICVSLNTPIVVPLIVRQGAATKRSCLRTISS